jgi:hypothetical protein
MAVKRIINDRQRARKVYGFVQRLPDPVSLSVTAAESDVIVATLDWKESVQYASTGSVTLPPGDVSQDIDGSMNTLGNGDRILLKNQSTSSENGIYIVNTSTNTWERTDDAIPGTTLTCGATTYVEGGTINEGSKWILSTKNVTLGGAQTWVLFDRGNDWIVSGSGGQMKTQDSVVIGNDFASHIATDVYFYVSGSRAALGASGSIASRTVFAGDVVISGSVNMVNSDGFFGDTLEISGSAKITTGSLYMQKAGTNDYVFFANSDSGVVFHSGSLYHSGSTAQGYRSEATGSFSVAMGIFSDAPRFAQYSQASSGLAASYTGNVLGESQYVRIVWTGQALNGQEQLLFKGYDSSTGNLTQFLNLENGKTYAIRATAAIVDTGNSSDSYAFISDALVCKSSDVVSVLDLNTTLAMPNSVVYSLEVASSGSLSPYNSDLSFYIDAVTPSTFDITGSLKGTVTIEMTEIKI